MRQFLSNLIARWQEWRANRQQRTDVNEQFRERDVRDRLRRDLRDDVRARRQRQLDEVHRELGERRHRW